MTVSNEAVEAAARAIYEQNPCGEQDFDADFRPTGPGYVIEFDALPEYDAGLYELSLTQARAALEAAAPHMLPAPEGVSEAENRVRAYADDPPSLLGEDEMMGLFMRQDIYTLLSALSSERERAERAERERDEARAAFILRDGMFGQAEARGQAAEAKVKELEAPFDWTAEDLVDLMAEAIMDAIDIDTNATDYARAALIALNKEGLLRPNDYREPQQ